MPEVLQGEALRWKRDYGNTPFTLDDAPLVMGYGPETAIRLVILGEAPGSDEESQGKPFVGKSGKLLHGYLKEAGIYSAGCYFTNVIDRRPPNNDIKSPQAREAIEVQRAALWDELRWLRSRGMVVILALGNTAKDFFGIKDSITKCRGSVYEVSLNWEGVVTDPANEPCDFVVIPTYHPAYLLRGYGMVKKNANMTMDQKLAWVEDMKKAHELCTKGYARPVEHFTRNPTFDQVTAFCTDAIRRKALIAVDIETSGFNPKADYIICIGMATDSETAICVPFFRTGPNEPKHSRYWPNGQESKVRQWLTQVFNTCPLVLQNALFDISYLQQSGYDIDISVVQHDTMLLHHAIAAELPHTLGFIASVYGHTPYWKGEFLTRDTTIWQMDFTDLQVYNMRDCIVLHQVLQPLLADMRELGTEVAYSESLSLLPVVMEMQQTGIRVNRTKLRTQNLELDSRIATCIESLRSMASLPEQFNFNSTDDTLLFLYGIKSKKHLDAANYAKHKIGSGIYESKRQLNEMVQQLHPIYIPQYRGRTTDSGQPALDKKGIAGLRIHVQNRLAYLEALQKPTDAHHDEITAIRKYLEWLTLFSEYKQLTKLKSTFSEFPIRDDGRIHPSILIHGTSTGRLSCSKPNMQQVPKDTIRSVFEAPPGHVILAVDFNNLEFRVMAYECGDPKMLEIIDKGLNQHDENTKALFNITPDSDRWELCRRAAKTFQFGTQYGGGDREVYEGMVIQVPEMNLTFADFKVAKRRYESVFNGWAAWRDRTMIAAKQTRKSWTAFGRCRCLFGSDADVGKQGLNTPCQGGAAHIINVAARCTYDELHAANMRSRLQIQIHDELRLEVPNDELHATAEIVKRCMEQPFDYRGRIVTFPVNIEVGPDWYNLKEYSCNSPCEV